MKHAAIQHNGLRITGQWATDPTEFQPKNKKGNYGPPVPCSPDGSIGEAYADCNIYAVSRGTLVYVPANVNLTLKRITGTAHAISNGVLTVTRTVKNKTAAEKTAEATAGAIAAVEAHMNAKAAEKNYESLHSASEYAGSVNPFQAESKAFVTWRGDCWAYCYTVLADVQAQTRTQPTNDELIAELPALVW